MLTHIPTGLADFDATFGGLEIGIQTLVVGQTGDGKSVLLKKLAEEAAKAGRAALVYFVEDPEKRTADRFLSTETGLLSRDLARLEVDERGMQQLADAVAGADWADRVNVKFGPVEADEILADVKATRDVAGAPLGLVAVDYAQALSGEGGMEEICASTSRALQVVAEARGLATVMGSQPTSEVLKRGRERYVRDGSTDGFVIGLGDAMWSRRLEQYSKAVITILRPGRWRKLMGEDARDDSLEIHVPKCNFGPSGGHVTFHWDGATSTIRSRGKR